MQQRYVVVLDLPNGDRLFCSDQYRDEWSGSFGYADSFRALHEAEQVALRHGGRVAPWSDMHALDATS